MTKNAWDLDLYVESLTNFRRSAYAIQFILPKLRDAGIRVRVLDRPASSDRPATAFLHVDLTVVPETYRGIRELYQRTINGDALSIHRSLYSTLRLKPGEPYAGPVIVKTVLNNRGRPELRWQQHRNGWSRSTHALRKIFDPGFKQRLAPPYRVYASRADVPGDVWQDERLMVERFAFPTLDLPIIKHRCHFLFDIELNMRQSFDDVLCSSKKIIDNQVADFPAPDRINAIRQQFQLDYGSIDYFLVDGEAVVIDVNRTFGASVKWLKKYAFRREFHDRVAAKLVDFVNQRGFDV